MGHETGECDRALAQAVARSDEASVVCFFRAYHSGVYRFMLCLTGNPEDAEDLAQDSLLKAKAHIRSFRGESSLKTWVHRVAYRTFTHWKRRRKPQSELNGQIPVPRLPFEQIDAAEVLLAALAKLGPALAQPLVLLEINDLSVNEIARVMDIPAGTVKSRLFAARKRLREILGDQHAES